MLKVVVAAAVVQQIMTEFNGAVLEEAKILAITKLSLISWSKTVAAFHRHGLLY
jgi:hypothetical protein